MMNSMTLFDQRIDRFRLLTPDDHEIVEIKTSEYIERLLELAGYKEEIRRPARIFIAWISGAKRDATRAPDEAKMLADMVQKRETAILPNNMEALRVYADLIRIGAEVAEWRIALIEERTRRPFNVINGAPAKSAKKKQPRQTPDLRRVI